MEPERNFYIRRRNHPHSQTEFLERTDMIRAERVFVPGLSSEEDPVNHEQLAEYEGIKEPGSDPRLMDPHNVSEDMGPRHES